MKRSLRVRFVAPVVLLSLLYSGCRGYSTSKPPIHLNPNMDTQEKGRAYKHSDFFEDGQYMRTPIEGTLARKNGYSDEHYYQGTVDGKIAESFPNNIVIDEKFLKRGQQVFNRVCASCHDHVGSGDGLVGRRLLVPPSPLHSDRLRMLPPGHFFKVISEGERTMQSLKHMLPVYDRWAATAYVRTLQISQDSEGEWIKRSAQWWTQQ